MRKVSLADTNVLAFQKEYFEKVGKYPTTYWLTKKEIEVFKELSRNYPMLFEFSANGDVHVSTIFGRVKLVETSENWG